MKKIGSNPNGNWVVYWNCDRQTYYVFYKGKLFVKRFRFGHVQEYLQ